MREEIKRLKILLEAEIEDAQIQLGKNKDPDLYTNWQKGKRDGFRICLSRINSILNIENE